MKNIFRRYTAGIEARSIDGAADGTLPPITGMAALYFDPENQAGTEYPLGGPNIVERLSAGIFDPIIGSEDDILALQDHDPALFLGRRSSGTLQVSLTDKGLAYRIDTPCTQVGQDTLSLIQRRDIQGASVAMYKPKGSWSFEMQGLERRYIRTVTSLEKVVDLGPVLQPAYPGTSAEIGFRSRGVTLSKLSAGVFSASEEMTEVQSELQGFIQENWNRSEAAYRLRQLEFLSVGMD